MEKVNFDDIVRNLMVFLKGQVPSLQSKHSRDDLVHQIQNIVYTLRTFLIQLEAASSSDPRKTPEYQSAIQEIESFKKTNARLEESLFLEMSKHQKLTAEIDKQAVLLKDRDQNIAQLNNEIAALQRQIGELQNRPPSEMQSADFESLQAAREEEKAAFADEKARLEAAVAEAGAKTQSATEEMIRLSTELNKVREEYERATQRLDELQSLSETIDRERQLKERAEQALGAAKLEFNQEREQLTAEVEKLRKEYEELKNQPLKDQDTYRKIIKALQEKIDKLQRTLHSGPAGDAIQNIQAAAEARIKALEMALAEAKCQIELGTPVSPEKFENLTRENNELQQRIIDLEATVRRLLATKEHAQGEQTQGLSSGFQCDEIILFFEVLTTLISKLGTSPENRDLRQKAEKAFTVLEKTHAVEPVSSLGRMYEEKMHKVVKSFIAPFLDDGMVVNEISRGYLSGDQIIQRAVVWVAKSRFQCSDCGSPSRPQDNFCPKCGLELCAPDGTPKRRLPQLPTDPEIGIQLLDVLIGQRQIKAMQGLLAHLMMANPGHNGLLIRNKQITQILSELPPEG